MLLNTFVTKFQRGFFPISHGNSCLKHALSFSFITVNVTGYDLRRVRNGLETWLLLCLKWTRWILFPPSLSFSSSPPAQQHVSKPYELFHNRLHPQHMEGNYVPGPLGFFPFHCGSSHLRNALLGSWCKQRGADRVELSLVMLNRVQVGIFQGVQATEGS